MPSLVFSKSSLGMLFNCPKSYAFKYKSAAPKKTDYYRLLGVLVHAFIAKLYDVSSDKPKRFHYESLEKAKGAWFYKWKQACDTNRHLIRFPNPKLESDLGGIGWACIYIYWVQNFEKPNPLFVEHRERFNIMPGVDLVGIFDQIRIAPFSVIAKYRPEILKNGQLHPDYDPCFVIDLKTNTRPFKPYEKDREATDMEWAAAQMELHEDLQVTAYHWLYYKKTGKLPAGFFWYHLRSGEYFFTWRTKKDFQTLFDQIKYAVNVINAGIWPKVVGSHCAFCDYMEPCAALRDDRPLVVTKPVTDAADNLVHVPAPVVKVEKSRQRRLKLNVPRVKKRPIEPEPIQLSLIPVIKVGFEEA